MKTHTFGSDEGFEAVHEAMLDYIARPRRSDNFTRGAFHTSFNLNDATMLLNVLEFVMMNGKLATAHLTPDEPQAQQEQVMLEWAEQYYRDLAGTVGVELV